MSRGDREPLQGGDAASGDGPEPTGVNATHCRPPPGMASRSSSGRRVSAFHTCTERAALPSATRVPSGVNASDAPAFAVGRASSGSPVTGRVSWTVRSFPANASQNRTSPPSSAVTNSVVPGRKASAATPAR